jgi:AcrR family transcriptional regulator
MIEKDERPWRERKKDKIKARILKEARHLFLTQGYDKSSIDDVAVKAEISKSSFYNYFQSKDELLYNCRDQLIVEITDEIAKNAGNSAWDRIVAGFSTFAAQSFARVPLARRITLADAERSGDPSEQFMAIHGIFIRLVEEAKELEGMRRDIESCKIVDMFFGAYFTVIFLFPSELSQEQILERLRMSFEVMRPGLFV